MKHLELDRDRRAAAIAALQRFYGSEFDETLSDFRAERLIDALLQTIGPSVYNQAVQDVRAHLQGKLDDLDGEVYVPEEG